MCWSRKRSRASCTLYALSGRKESQLTSILFLSTPRESRLIACAGGARWRQPVQCELNACTPARTAGCTSDDWFGAGESADRPIVPTSLVSLCVGSILASRCATTRLAGPRDCGLLRRTQRSLWELFRHRSCQCRLTARPPWEAAFTPGPATMSSPDDSMIKIEQITRIDPQRFTRCGVKRSRPCCRSPATSLS